MNSFELPFILIHDRFITHLKNILPKVLTQTIKRSYIVKIIIRIITNKIFFSPVRKNLFFL
jgi:hypothetical protein